MALALNKKDLGLAAIVAGGALIAYDLTKGGTKTASGNEVAFAAINVNPPSPQAQQAFSLAVTLSNPTATQFPYGIQATIVQGNGKIGGHLWSSGAIAQMADAAYNTAYNNAGGGQAGTVAGDQAVAQMAALAADRVVYVDIAGGAQGSATLYGDPLEAGTYTVYIFAMASPPANTLIIGDANASTFNPNAAAGGQVAHVQVSVG